MAPVFSLVLDEDVSADIALTYPELYQELMKVEVLPWRSQLTSEYGFILVLLLRAGKITLLEKLLCLGSDQYLSRLEKSVCTCSECKRLYLSGFLPPFQVVSSCCWVFGCLMPS